MSSELRKDPVLGRWVIIAGERSKRPNPFRNYPMKVEETKPCPFCPGHEEETPPQILAYPAFEAGPSRWSVRVVPNRFPALRIEGELDQRGEGLYDKMRGIGAHEVVIEIPQHDSDPASYPPRQMSEMIRAYRERVIDLLRDSRFRSVLVFKNQGAAAGATLAHPHSQIIALPIVPARIVSELAGAAKYHEYRGRCIYCDILSQELSDTRRLVVQNNDFVAYAPYASRFPFEVSILPRVHNAFFWEISDAQMKSLAEILQDVLRRYKLALKDPPYNYIFHTAPPGHRRPAYYHWQVEVIPKLSEAAGFEWGSGFYINPMPPEEAAEHLRDLHRFMDIPAGHLLAGKGSGDAAD
ncbi:MAG TPA: galactose-1-phosphate uridylyltransferase [Candidatus Polarisedimenticolia bacterium]|jgi:UDPglucose--hexose-1-phosphate uridylyltransferase|nr:galactose-1-phosphate uridylyltransferase [Candidatus Polarisedimenticolia bacterium]